MKRPKINHERNAILNENHDFLNRLTPQKFNKVHCNPWIQNDINMQFHEEKNVHALEEYLNQLLT